MSMHGSKVRLVNGKGHFLMDDNYTTDFNEKDTEIKELTLSNLKLIEQLKALNKEVDMKVVKLRHVTSFMTPPSERSEEVLVSTKLEAAKKMLRNCEKEIERIKAELATKTGYEKVLELEAKSSDLEKVQAELQRNVAALHKKVTVSAKELALHNQKKSEGIFQIEEKAALIALNKMREKSVEYEQQLKAMVDGAPIREGKIKQLNETADELQKKIAQLKKEAAQFKKNSKGKELNEKLDKEKVKVEIERAKAEVDATQKKFKEEKVSWDQQLEKLKEQLRTLEKQNSTNTHKIIEYTRIQKATKLKRVGSPPLKPERDKKKEAAYEKMERMKKYNSKIVIKHKPVPELPSKAKSEAQEAASEKVEPPVLPEVEEIPATKEAACTEREGYNDTIQQ